MLRLAGLDLGQLARRAARRADRGLGGGAAAGGDVGGPRARPGALPRRVRRRRPRDRRLPDRGGARAAVRRRSATSCCGPASSTASAVTWRTRSRAAHDGGRTLQHLEHEGALIVGLDRRGRWFRYHGLFLELLRARLDQAHPGLRADLHARAGTWLAANGCGREALPHIVAAEPTDALVARARRPLGRPRPGGAGSPTRSCAPRSHLGGDARLRVAAAGTCLEAGEVAQAESMLEGLGDAPADVRVLAQLFAGSRSRGRSGRSPRRGPSGCAADAAGRAIVLAHRGAVEFAYGEPQRRLRGPRGRDRAGARGAKATRCSSPASGAPRRSRSPEGRLSRAERAAHSALAVAEGRGGRWSAGAAWACAALAAVHWLRDEPDQAEARADLGAAAAHGAGDVLAARAVRAVRGHLAIARGDIAGGCASLATAGLQRRGWRGHPVRLARRARASPGRRRRAGGGARDRGGRARPARPRRPALRAAPRRAAARPDRARSIRRCGSTAA